MTRQISIRIPESWCELLERLALAQQIEHPDRRWHGDGVADVVRSLVWERMQQLSEEESNSD